MLFFIPCIEEYNSKYTSMPQYTIYNIIVYIYIIIYYIIGWVILELQPPCCKIETKEKGLYGEQD